MINTDNLTPHALAFAAKSLNTNLNDLTIQKVNGGFSRNRRALVSDGTNWLFVKEVDLALLKGDGSVELAWLRKDFDCVKKLQAIVPDLAADYVQLSGDGRVLLMSAYRPDDGWLWQPPVDIASQSVYIEAVLDAADRLETIAFDTAEIEQLQLKPFLAAELHDKGALDRLLNDFDLRVSLLDRYSKDTYSTSQLMLNFLQDSTAIKTLAHDADGISELASNRFNHCDLRSDNLAYNPSTGATKIVDWNWASYAPSGAGAAEFLINLATQGIDVKPWLYKLDHRFVAAIVGFYLQRCTLPPLAPGNNLRAMQAQSAATALELWSLIKR